MVEKQEGTQISGAAMVDIQRPKEPPFNLEREISWLRHEMLKTGTIAKEKLSLQTRLQQKYLEPIYEPLRRQVGEPPEREEIARECQEYLIAAKQEFMQLEIEQRIRGMIANERRSSLSPRVGSCAPAYAPYPNSYQYPDVYGGDGLESYLNASIGCMGWYVTTYPIGGETWLATGVGEWVYSGANSGMASLRADLYVWGRCVEYSPGGYIRNIVRVHVRTWDATGQVYDAQQTIHDNWEVIGFSIRDFSDVFSPTVYVPIQPYRWYLVWAWVEQYAVGCPIICGGGQNLWIYANRLEICT